MLQPGDALGLDLRWAWAQGAEGIHTSGEKALNLYLWPVVVRKMCLGAMAMAGPGEYGVLVWGRWRLRDGHQFGSSLVFERHLWVVSSFGLIERKSQT